MKKLIVILLLIGSFVLSGCMDSGDQKEDVKKEENKQQEKVSKEQHEKEEETNGEKNTSSISKNEENKQQKKISKEQQEQEDISEGECKDGLCVFNLSDSSETSTGKKLMTYQPRNVDLSNGGYSHGDSVPGLLWGCYESTTNAGSNTDGSENTQTITLPELENCADDDNNNGPDHYCNQLSITVNDKTYDDWYLPAKFELDAMCERDNFSNGVCGDEGLNDMDIGGEIGSSRMWSSTEGSSDSARSLSSDGNWNYSYKGYTAAVQCVRSVDQ